MDKIDLEELERLAAQAESLPWKLKLHLGKVVRVTEKGNERYIADCIRTDKRAVRCKQNAAYIVAACNAVPELIAMVREMEERIAELTQENSGHKRVIHILENKVLALKGKPIPMEPRQFIPSSNRSNAKEAGV